MYHQGVKPQKKYPLTQRKKVPPELPSVPPSPRTPSAKSIPRKTVPLQKIDFHMENLGFRKVPPRNRLSIWKMYIFKKYPHFLIGVQPPRPRVHLKSTPPTYPPVPSEEPSVPSNGGSWGVPPGGGAGGLEALLCIRSARKKNDLDHYSKI